MARNLEEVGIKATVQPYDQTTWQTRVQNGEFTMSIGWSDRGATIFNFYRGVMATETKKPIGESSTQNWHRYANTEADALLAAFAATSDDAEQRDIANQLQQIYAENAPAVPLFPGPQWGAVQQRAVRWIPVRGESVRDSCRPTTNERGIVMTTVTPKAAS